MEESKEKLYTEATIDVQNAVADERLTVAEKIGILEAVKFDLLAQTCSYRQNKPK